MHIDVLQKLKRNSGQFEGGGSSKWTMFLLCLGRGRPCLLFIQQLFTISSLFFSNGGYICSRNWNTEFTWDPKYAENRCSTFPENEIPKNTQLQNTQTKYPKNTSRNTQKKHREIPKCSSFSEYPKNTSRNTQKKTSRNTQKKHRKIPTFLKLSKIPKKYPENTWPTFAKIPTFRKTSILQHLHFRRLRLQPGTEPRIALKNTWI